ncbi:hypothetical protein O1611_g10586 [Lasiodiplodia mahajangana]|uniref:Uncharacterized protein n=1 Tax=Lasiodiplodia mahajangana TaxID=1108764 RepID=A0ACC2IWF8_9PEZI|nr:hypothetical protein O1611_g10586 [Lasiodiplodia mahajangana]
MAQGHHSTRSPIPARPTKALRATQPQSARGGAVEGSQRPVLPARQPVQEDGTLLKPKSNPTYFTDLLKELEEAPNRSFLERLMVRMKGLVRLQ